MAKSEERDQVDEFLEQDYVRDIPNLDLEVEGIVHRVSKIYKLLDRLFDQTLAEHGLTRVDSKILSALSRKTHARSAGNLAEIAELSSGAMTNRLDRLEDAGLVRRLRDPSDRRGVLVELTPKGRRAYREASGAEAAKEALIASALTKKEKDQLNTLLRRFLLELDRLKDEA
jgi:DNA-binding MarR family transcriptional regulator